jgi:hypothetical protein
MREPPAQLVRDRFHLDAAALVGESGFARVVQPTEFRDLLSPRHWTGKRHAS